MPYLSDFYDRYITSSETNLITVSEIYENYKRWARLYSDGEPSALALTRSRTRFYKCFAALARARRLIYNTFGKNSYGVSCTLPERLFRHSLYLSPEDFPFNENDIMERATSYLAQDYDQRIPSLPIKRIFIDRTKHYGAFAVQHIRRLQIICEYFGLEIKVAEAEKREDMIENQRQATFIYTSENTSIRFNGNYDSTGNFLGIEKNHGDWLNRHSSLSNCEIRKVRIEDKNRLIVVAKYRIHSGTELTHNNEIIQLAPKASRLVEENNEGRVR
ncbi:uncharacterized protein LOC144447807 [Glandiceps talaboti]